jgi:hypothetical protein
MNFGPINISGGQNVVGKNEGTMNQSVDGKPIDLGKLMSVVAESLPSDVSDVVIPKIQGIASLPTEQQQREMASGSAWSFVRDSIAPHAETIARNLAIFGAAALKALSSSNPVVAGILAVCEANVKPSTGK